MAISQKLPLNICLFTWFNVLAILVVILISILTVTYSLPIDFSKPYVFSCLIFLISFLTSHIYLAIKIRRFEYWRFSYLITFIASYFSLLVLCLISVHIDSNVDFVTGSYLILFGCYFIFSIFSFLSICLRNKRLTYLPDEKADSEIEKDKILNYYPCPWHFVASMSVFSFFLVMNLIYLAHIIYVSYPQKTHSQAYFAISLTLIMLFLAIFSFRKKRMAISLLQAILLVSTLNTVIKLFLYHVLLSSVVFSVLYILIILSLWNKDTVRWINSRSNKKNLCDRLSQDSVTLS